jgi:ribosomal protein L11 methyltransferase
MNKQPNQQPNQPTSSTAQAPAPAISLPLPAAENRYFRLVAAGIRRHDEDEFTQACFDVGADGVAEDLKFVQKDLRYDPDVVETPLLDVNVYFAKAPDEDLLLKLEARFPGVRFEMHNEENKDWLAEWKKGFKAFPFAGPFWVIPAWLKPPAEAPYDTTKHIYVEPGMAFGTGTHETTRLAASLVIEETLRSKPQSLLDVGTGTGILALIAYRLGVPHNVGIDIDPEARRTARENLERNHATAIQIPDENLEDVREIFDLVIANIIDGVLTVLRHDLVRVLKPGCRMVVSGVLMDREAEFYAGFTADTGLRVIKKISEGEWSAAILEKKA